MAAKRPPPKKSPPLKAERLHPHPGGEAVSALLDAATQDVVDGLVKQNASRAHIRWRAKLHYVMDLDQCSTDDMHKMPVFSVVPLQQLQKWCWADGWAEERKQFLERVRTQAEKALGDRLVGSLQASISDLSFLRGRILEKFKPHAYEMHVGDEKKTWKTLCRHCGRGPIGHNDPFYGEDGTALVKGLVAVLSLETQLSELVLGRISATIAGDAEGKSNGQLPAPVSGTISGPEALVAAHAILRRRHTVQRPVAGASADAEPGAASDDDLADTGDEGDEGHPQAQGDP